jgi:NADPH2:quinone reductase
LPNSGAFADQVAVAATKLVKLPDNLSEAIAAGFYINYATALYGLRDCGQLRRGETILILGAAGGVGSSAICVAKAMGATGHCRRLQPGKTPSSHEASVQTTA